MNVIALVKQVPDTAQLSGTVDGLRLMEDGGPRIVNPWDDYALETAVRLKESHGGKVTVLTVGRPEAEQALKTGLGIGADDAVLVSDPVLEGSDCLATARVLAAAIQRIGDYDIIVAGRSAIDGNTAATPVQVAALLNLPLLSYVSELNAVDPAARNLKAVRLLEGGRESVTSRLPAVITVVKEICEPRYPSFIDIRRAAKATIRTFNVADLGLTPDQVGTAGSGVTWPDVYLPTGREARVELIEGSPAECARILAEKLTADHVL